jgi:predicted metalloprotease
VPSLGPNGIVLDDRFNAGPEFWPSSTDSTAWYADGAYHLEPREPGKFVALDAPLSPSFSNVAVWARFHKTGGPPGGGYGLIVDDQTSDLDGTNQSGRYIALEVGDEGTVGAWQRQQDHWDDLMTWTSSAAVRTDNGVNDLVVRVQQTQLTFIVNGAPVAQLSTAMPGGRVGVFVGGDGNQVALDRFVVQAPISSDGGALAPTAAQVPTEPTLEDLNRQLDVAWAAGNWPTVFDLLDRIEQDAPTALDFRDKRYAAHLAAGQAALTHGDTLDAAREFEQASTLDPERGEASTALSALTPTPAPESGPNRPTVDEPLQDFVEGALGDLGSFWTSYFAERGQHYVLPGARWFTRAIMTGCGPAVSGLVGPFYCVGDSTVYLDAGFIQAIRTAAGDSPVAYVLAHEVGHHVQHQLGISKTLEVILFGRTFSHEIELQADCLAGAWLHSAVNRNIAAPDDVTRAVVVAWALGDSPGSSQAADDAHGTPAQHAGAFLKGFNGDGPAACGLD